MNPKTALHIAQAAAPKMLTPEHKRFQALLAKIDKAKLRLQQWQEQLPLFARVHAEQADPVLARLRAARRAWAFELEQHLLRGKWSKADKATLRRHVEDLSGALMDDADEPDDELKSLFNRHSPDGYEQQGQQQMQSLRDFIEQGTGLDLGDEPIDSVDELFQRARAQLGEQQAAARGDSGPRARKPTAAQRRQEAKAREDAERVSQSVREVYRKLAAALHPDRCPAQASAEERATRTEQMARANAAYAADDLLALLSLQLQIEQVDIVHAASVAAAQVKHFNKVLAEQLAELEADVQQREMAFCASYGLVTEQRLDPLKLGLLLKEEMRDLAVAEQRVAWEQRQLHGTPAQARQWLKALREAQRQDDDPFSGLFF